MSLSGGAVESWRRTGLIVSFSLSHFSSLPKHAHQHERDTKRQLSPSILWIGPHSPLITLLHTSPVSCCSLYLFDDPTNWRSCETVSPGVHANATGTHSMFAADL